MSYSFMLLQNQPNYKGENMHIQKVILSSDLLLSPPTLQIETLRA